jgi:hypothetical protein
VVTRDGVRSVAVQRDNGEHEHAPLIVEDEWAVPQAERQEERHQQAQLRAAAVRVRIQGRASSSLTRSLQPIHSPVYTL